MMPRILLLTMALVEIAIALFPSSGIAAPPITAVAFAPEGESVIATSQAGAVIHSWPSLEVQRTVKVAFSNIHDVSFSPDGTRFAIAGGDPTERGGTQLFLWPQCHPIQLVAPHSDSAMSATWIDQHKLASAAMDHQLILSDLAPNKTSMQSFNGHSRGITSVDHLPGTSLLVSGGLDQSLRVWNAQTGELIRNMSIHVKPVNDVAFRPSGDGLPMLASASDDTTVRFWQPTIGRMVRFARLPSAPRSIAWMKDGSAVAACCDDGGVYAVDPNTVEVTCLLSPARDRDTEFWAYAIAVHPKEDSLVVAGSGGVIRRVAVPTRKQ